MICANLREEDDESLLLKQQHKICLCFHVTLNVIDLLKNRFYKQIFRCQFFLINTKNTQILRKNAFF